ncbi:MAG: hypothetical protein ACRCTT_15610, partial [Enterobacter roggenkampii]
HNNYAPVKYRKGTASFSARSMLSGFIKRVLNKIRSYQIYGLRRDCSVPLSYPLQMRVADRF